MTHEAGRMFDVAYSPHGPSGVFRPVSSGCATSRIQCVESKFGFRGPPKERMMLTARLPLSLTGQPKKA